jgi:hypothetical protein
MRNLGAAHGVTLWAQDDSYLSFYNSPYVGHTTAKAVDIYPRTTDWVCNAVSPIDGIVTRIQKTKMGREKQFPTSDFDYGIGITTENQNDTLVRILHCIPDVEIGDRIDRGDNIGKTLRSRYFNYWTGPHYHVEVMNEKHFSRSTQSYVLTPNISEVNLVKQSNHWNLNKLEYEIEMSQVSDDNIIGFSSDIPYGAASSLHGHLGFSEDHRIYGIIDGGIPHYKFGGIHSPSGGISDGVFFCNSLIGINLNVGFQFKIRKNVCIFLDEFKLRGLSFFLYPKTLTSKGRPPIVIIPSERSQLSDIFKIGDIAKLSIMELDKDEN